MTTPPVEATKFQVAARCNCVKCGTQHKVKISFAIVMKLGNTHMVPDEIQDEAGWKFERQGLFLVGCCPDCSR